jgi:putative transposase
MHFSSCKPIFNSLHVHSGFMSSARQREFRFRTWGGRRRGAGRKPTLQRARMGHDARPEHTRHHPVHATMRAARGLPSLRKQRVFLEIRSALKHTVRSWFRILHFSVQTNHIHLLVEADDKVSLSRGLVGVAVRLARAINRVLRRRGAVWGDRFHSRALRTPREVRHGIVYVIMNWRKHVPNVQGLDPCSSALLFDGWRVPPASGPPDPELQNGSIQRPETWLARTGWKRHGLVDQTESPQGSL